MSECICLWCSRKMRAETTLKAMFYVDDVICESCRQKMDYHPVNIRINELKVRGLYCYKEVTREMIIRYKELYDEALNPVFLYPLIDQLKRKYRGYILVPVPSSDKNNEARGFRAVEKIFGNLGLEVADVLYKLTDFDQKTAGFNQRREIGKHLGIRNAELIEGRKVLLVDDVITSGASIYECYRLIKPNCRKASGLVISYNQRYLRTLPLTRMFSKVTELTGSG